DHERGSALARDALDDGSQFSGSDRAGVSKISFNRIGGAFPDLQPIEINARHASLGGEGNKFRLKRAQFAATQSVLFFRQDDNRSALGSFISERRKLRGFRQGFLFDTGQGNKRRGLTISQRNRSRLIQQQSVYVAGCFDG